MSEELNGDANLAQVLREPALLLLSINREKFNLSKVFSSPQCGRDRLSRRAIAARVASVGICPPS
jgi:hypothetical protein